MIHRRRADRLLGPAALRQIRHYDVRLPRSSFSAAKRSLQIVEVSGLGPFAHNRRENGNIIAVFRASAYGNTYMFPTPHNL